MVTASSNVLTVVSTLVLESWGLVAVDSSAYNTFAARLVPLGVPVLQLDADLRRVSRDGRSLLVFSLE